MNSKKKACKDMRIPREIWIIFDPLGGPHLFTSEKGAWKEYRKWRKAAIDYGPQDSFWDMPEPSRYIPMSDKKTS